ncbi:outer membrane lipoprotein-sorting protein [Neptunomonas antarctica]|uniref:Outer membrane lipoprotein-sorting protein n=1 Tax=Neptunomonas antarctica TaxID=619304 RepID=A0A1N7LLH1_9GAMM|nr:outer membrane lipoprotein-sorting protein [Neptunomonas antarctica]SIS74644.1 outer membrane lipoprotein-sorting protein [Neptunomonas antarctica]
MNLQAKTINWLLPAILLASASFSYAETAEEKGLAIAKQTKQSDIGWTDMTAQMQMVLRNSEGQESIRDIRMQSLEKKDDGDKSLSIFDRPLDVKGTAFLSFSHPGEADDQWLYLPALKRVKRIASRNKSGPFMGSEFAYEDLTSFEIEKYTYKYLRDESCGTEQCYVVEQYPVDEYSGYTRRVVWIDQSENRLHKIDFYDRKNSLLKTLTYAAYQQYLGKHWRPDMMKMDNHLTKKNTDLIWTDYQFNTGLSDADFNRNSLKRAH